jgi:hypothetical protein
MDGYRDRTGQAHARTPTTFRSIGETPTGKRLTVRTVRACPAWTRPRWSPVRRPGRTLPAITGHGHGAAIAALNLYGRDAAADRRSLVGVMMGREHITARDAYIRLRLHAAATSTINTASGRYRKAAFPEVAHSAR